VFPLAILAWYSLSFAAHAAITVEMSSCDLCNSFPMTRHHGFVSHHLQKRTSLIEIINSLLQISKRLPFLQGFWKFSAPNKKEHSQITGHTFDVEADNFLLRNLMEAPLLQYKEDIEVRKVF
jgi:hypothetical protein